MARTSRQFPPDAVTEVQGLYGPFTFPEKLLQKIWLRGAFGHAGAVTADGRRVGIVHPGKWNLLGGPDFLGARLRLGDGREFTGDVELHLHADDWAAHAHAADRAYDGVALHVVLFPPPRGHVTRGAEGREIPVLALLPLLHHDLEEYAAEDAVETLAGRPASQVTEALAPLPVSELAAMLREHAAARWRQKIHFARRRVQRLGWEAACHHAALEILGYRFNRAAMLRVAAAHPIGEWVRGAAEPDGIFEAGRAADSWSVQGVRPANHPRTRLHQYAAWVQAQPDWPARLAELAEKLPAISDHDLSASTAAVRRAHHFTRVRVGCAALAGNAIGGTRLDNLVCDGFLPLLAAREAGGEFVALWAHWFPGDLPPMVLRVLRDLGVFGPRGSPASHGTAQGLLGWLMARESAAAQERRGA